MNAHIISVDTYGSMRITAPQTGKQISAYKMGYTTAVTAVLLALYGEKAHDVSPKQASYRYVQIDGDVVVQHGYILLTLTADELGKAEQITRQSHRAGVFLWRDKKWWAFPDNSHPDYTEPGYRVGLSFDPTGFRPPSPSTGERETTVSGITAERSQRSASEKPWWWLSGETYPHRELLKRYGARFSSRRKQWYFIGAELPAAIRALVSIDSPETPEAVQVNPAVGAMSPELATMIEDALAQDHDARTPAEAAAPEMTSSAIRIRQSPPLPVEGEPLDAVQTAIRSVKAQPIAAVTGAALANGRTAHIEQAYVGELTGSITGQVFCYGWAVHDGICLYVNMAGPRMGVEAIRAKLSKGDQVSVVPPDAPTVELTAGEGNSGMYHSYLHYLPEARFASLILVHDWAVTPNYGGKATTFIFRTNDGQATAKLKQHVMQLVNIPVFEAWSAYLYEAGQRAMLVRKTRSAGGIDLLSVDLDVDAWTRLITGGLEQEIIALPVQKV
jgi:hypothetical protein